MNNFYITSSIFGSKYTKLLYVSIMSEHCGIINQKYKEILKFNIGEVPLYVQRVNSTYSKTGTRRDPIELFIISKEGSDIDRVTINLKGVTIC